MPLEPSPVCSTPRAKENASSSRGIAVLLSVLARRRFSTSSTPPAVREKEGALRVVCAGAMDVSQLEDEAIVTSLSSTADQDGDHQQPGPFMGCSPDLCEEGEEFCRGRSDPGHACSKARFRDGRDGSVEVRRM